MRKGPRRACKSGLFAWIAVKSLLGSLISHGKAGILTTMSVIEVAKVAGVSKSTVSRVINDHPSVSPEALRLVHEAIEQLNYRPR